MAVRILSDVVINQIAAGEVVERPASVVKELVENAIDAGATDISVVVSGGGRGSIEVLDNGSGMSRHDALLAIERFGTSKISSAGDLLGISTLGFRGEALPSIASVSKFRLTTALGDGSPGVEVEIDGGTLRAVREVSAAQGTKVEIRRLFFNVPARKKFLKSDAAELAAIKAFLTDISLCVPTLRLALISDGVEVLSFTRTKSFFERAAQQITGEVLKVDTQSERGRLQALFKHPRDAVSGSARLRIIVNRRAVRDRLVLKAVRDGFGMFLKSGKYPVGTVHLEVPPSDIDVNVHPQKTEVRFRDSGAVFALIVQAIEHAVRGARAETFAVPHTPMIARRDFGGGQAVQQPVFWEVREPVVRTVAPVEAEVNQPLVFEAPIESRIVPAESVTLESVPAEPPRMVAAKPALASMRYLGQMMGLYLIFEANDRMALVDMHAAHERVMFYKLRQSYFEGTSRTQALLIPETVKLPHEQYEAFASQQKMLEQLGFDCEAWNEETVVIRGVPALLAGVGSAARIFEDLFSSEPGTSWARQLETAADSVFARLACHSSVRAGRALDREEAYALVAVLDEVEAAAFCPHGRPTVLYISSAELERMFGRSGF